MAVLSQMIPFMPPMKNATYAKEVRLKWNVKPLIRGGSIFCFFSALNSSTDFNFCPAYKPKLVRAAIRVVIPGWSNQLPNLTYNL